MFNDKDNKFGNENGTGDCKYPEQINKDIISSEDESIYASGLNMTQSAEEKGKEKKKRRSKKEKTKKSGLWVPTLIMGASFTLAFAFLCLTLINAQRSSSLPLTPADESESESIYIKEYDDKSGMLTAQEIYSRSLPSVISVKAKGDTLQSIGTGFVFDTAGYIATAHHVIDSMSDISVITHDGREFAATLVASDELSDLALLKINCTDLTPLEFGRSSELMVGDELFAIGTPASLEFAGTMCKGEVSYNNRTVSMYNETDGTLKKKMTLIQTTAALNPGNSGGPVLDSYGKLVGIVTMKLGNNFDGISFIIPSDGAYGILCDMRDDLPLSDARRASVATKAAKMGVVAEAYSDGARLGVRVTDFVSDDCDAAKKIRIGDVIVSLDGSPISGIPTLTEAINAHKPGDAVSVTVYRSEQLLTFSIILGC